MVGSRNSGLVVPNNEVKNVTNKIRNRLLCSEAKSILWSGAEQPAPEAFAKYYERLQSAKEVFSSLSLPDRKKVSRKLANSTIAPHLPRKLHDRMDALALCDLVDTFKADDEPVVTLRRQLQELVSAETGSRFKDELAPLKRLLHEDCERPVLDRLQAYIRRKRSLESSFDQRMKNLRELRAVVRRPEFRRQCERAIIEGIHREDTALSEIAELARLPQGRSLLAESAVKKALAEELRFFYHDLEKHPPQEASSKVNLRRLEQVEFLGALSQILDTNEQKEHLQLKQAYARELYQLLLASVGQHQPILQLESFLDYIELKELSLPAESYYLAVEYVLHHLTLEPVEVFARLRRAFSIFDTEILQKLLSDSEVQKAGARALWSLMNLWNAGLQSGVTFGSLADAKGPLSQLVEIHLAMMAIAGVLFESSSRTWVPSGNHPFLVNLFGSVGDEQPQLVLYGSEKSQQRNLYEILPFSVQSKPPDTLLGIISERLAFAKRLGNSIEFNIGKLGVAVTELTMTDPLKIAADSLRQLIRSRDLNKVRHVHKISEVFLSPDASEFIYHASPLALAETAFALELECAGRR